GEIHGIEFEMVRKDGAHVAMAFDGRIGRDERGAFKQTHCILADVTERKRAEEALQESEERFRSFFDNAPVGKAITFPDGRVSRVNPALCRLLGYTAAELEGVSFEAITYPEDIPASREGLRSLLAGERSSWATEKRYVTRDGRIVWTHAVVSVQRDREGRPLHFLTHVLDVTERKRADEARALLAAIVESSNDAVIAKGLDGTILSWNPGAERLYGYAAGEAVGRNISILAPPESRQDLEWILERVARGQDVKHHETLRVRKDGTRVTVSLAVSPIRDATGAIVGASTVARDITERKRAEEALREAHDLLEERVADRTRELAETVSALEREAAERQRAQATAEEYTRRMEDLYNNAPCGYHSLDAEGTFIAVNDTELGWLGYAREEVVGRLKFTDLLTDEGRARFAANFPGFKARGWVADLEFDMVRRDGSLVPVVLSATAVVGEGGAFERSRSTMFDITDLKRARLEAARRTAELEAANAELEAFSYSVSHDLRAPLRSIDGFSRIVEEEYGGSLDSEGLRLLRVVRDSAHRMAQLIDDLLAFSRSARHPLQPSRIDMGALVRSTLPELVPEAARASREFTVGALPEAVGDAAMIRQVWVNLLGNAVKFTRPAARPAITVSGRVDGREVIYSVSDNGVGFDMAYAGKLFGVFQRLHPAREFEGTGVGLALVQRIVHRHGGRVWAEGAVGKGATFSFALPAPGGAA
ncbi:MAG: PAS domain S-box protein, partial [Thermoanaerobaculaceae bacterium]|nr:PAS domain S-box protein [Thermoanaerobaculaceae bacterium]